MEKYANDILKKKQKDNFFFTLLFSLYLGLSLIRFVWPEHLWMTAIIMGMGVFTVIHFITDIKRKDSPIYVYLGLLIVVFLVGSVMVSRTYRIGHVVIFIINSSGIALLMCRGLIKSWGVYIVFYSLTLYFGFIMYSGADPNSVLKVVSRNGVSMMMLVTVTSLYIVSTVEKKKLDVKPAIITLIISIWAVGRSGILSSAVLLLGILFIKSRTKKVLVAIIFIVAILIYLFVDSIFMYLLNNSFSADAISYHLIKSSENSSDVRYEIWQNYFNNLDFFRLIFGSNILLDPWPDGELLNYNYHSSSINLHSQTGFMGLITIALMIFSLIKFYRTNMVFFILLLTIILRWSTDIGLFFESWDYLVFFFIFHYLQDTYARSL